jgi:hypothetical protein
VLTTMISNSAFWPKGAAYASVPSEIELTTTNSRASIVSHQQTWSQKHLKGWRFGILSGSLLASLVFCINASATIYGGIDSEKNDNGRKVLYEGDCERVRRINLGLHLIINALSTILLSASNYGMQCLSAPTRKEIDLAHSKRKWLDIGVLSVKNIRNISGKRAWLWFLLGASSLPLHLL